MSADWRWVAVVVVVGVVVFQPIGAGLVAGQPAAPATVDTDVDTGDDREQGRTAAATDRHVSMTTTTGSLADARETRSGAGNATTAETTSSRTQRQRQHGTGVRTQTTDRNRRFVVQQDGESVIVTPLRGEDPIAAFYDYYDEEAHTNSGLERSEHTITFFWRGPDGALSLVIINDINDDGTGGAVSFDFEGLPEAGRWTIQDDPFDFNARDDVDWSWTGENTDGGAFTGGLDGNVSITIVPGFNEAADSDPLEAGRITDWEFLSGDLEAPDRISLDRSEPITIRSAADLPVARFDTRPSTPTAGRLVRFDAGASVTNGSGTASYTWSFGDGTSADGRQVVHRFESGGTYPVTLRLQTPRGTDTVTRNVTVAAADNASAATAPVSVLTTADPPLFIEDVRPDTIAVTAFPLTVPDATVAEVRFDFGNETRVDGDGSDGWQVSYDAATVTGQTLVNVTAVTERGERASTTQAIGVIDVPDPLVALLTAVPPETVQTPDRVRLAAAYPQLRIDVETEVPSISPVAAGKDVAIEYVNFSTGIAVDPDDLLVTLEGGAKADGEFVGGNLTVTGSVSGTVEITPDRTVAFRRGTVTGRASVAIPSYTTSAGFGPFVVSVVVYVTPGGGGELVVTNATDGYDLTANVSDLGVSLQPVAESDVGVGTVTVSGTTRLGYTSELIPDFLNGQQLVLSQSITAEVEAFGGTRTFEENASVDLLELANGSSAGLAEAGWTPVERTGAVALSTGAPTGAVETTTSADGATGVGGTDGDATAMTTRSGTRLTADRVSDQRPSVAPFGTTTAVVWERQPPGAPVADGHDLYWQPANRSGEAPRRITDDDRYDLAPSVTDIDTDTGALAIGWARVGANLTAEELARPTTVYPQLEIAVSEYVDGQWAAPTTLTDDTALDYAPRIAATGDSRLLVWQRDGDANLTTTDDRRVAYAVYTPATGWSEPRTLAAGTQPTVAPAGPTADGYHVAHAGPTGRNVSVYRVTTSDATRQRRYVTPAVRDVAVAGSTVLWATRTPPAEATDAAVTFARETDGNGTWTAPRPVPNATTGLRDLHLIDRPDGVGTVAVFRGVDPAAQTRVVRYRLRVGDRWLPAGGLLRATGNTSVSQLGVATDATTLTAVVAGRTIGTDEKRDLFAVAAAYAPDVAVNARLEPSSARPGETVTANVTVRNAGERPTADTVTVTVANGSGTVTTTTLAELAPGERRQVRVPVTVDATGRVTVAAETAGDPTPANDAVTLVAARPNLVATLVAAERDVTAGSETVTVTGTIENPTGVVVENVTYALRGPDGPVATGRLARLDAGRTRVVELTVARSRLPADGTVSLVVDPNDRISERSETDNRDRTALFRADAGLVESTVTVINTSYGTYLTALLSNDELGATTATVAVSPVGGNVSVETLTDAETVYRRVQVPLTGVAAGDRLEVVLASSTLDTDAGNDGVRTTATFQRSNLSANPSITASTAEPVTGSTVTFSVSTVLPAVLVRSVAWDLTGDGQIDRTGRRVTTTVTGPGERNVTVVVRTLNGRTVTRTTSIVVRPPEAAIVGEVGRLEVQQPNRSVWFRESFAREYTDPVVIAQPLSANGSDPAHLRLRNVTADGFEYRIEEWAYLDGSHPAERVQYLVVEAGTHVLDEGVRVIAGEAPVGSAFERVAFARSFDARPVALTQVQTALDPTPVITRVQDVTTDGASVRLQTAEAAANHSLERVGYVAVTRDTGTNFGLQFEAARTGPRVGSGSNRIGFAREYGRPPVVVAGTQTTNGNDPYSLRYRRLDETGIDLFLDEEQSNDDETAQFFEERVGWVLFQTPDVLYDAAAVRAGPRPVRERYAAPTDPDGDGAYEDLTGDGAFTILDVAVFLNTYTDAAADPAFYDFFADGQVDIRDVALLLEELD